MQAMYDIEHIFIAFLENMSSIIINNTPHAFRKICAPWGVTYFWGVW